MYVISCCVVSACSYLVIIFQACKSRLFKVTMSAPGDLLGLSPAPALALVEHGWQLSEWLDTARTSQWMCDVTIRSAEQSLA